MTSTNNVPRYSEEWESVMKEFRLSKKEIGELLDKYPTPFLVASLDKVTENYRLLRQHLPRVKVFYAMKANPAEAILQRMSSLGASFDVASSGEMQLLHKIGVDGSRMIYANPVKTMAGLRLAAEYGVDKFTFDDESEITKMAAVVPGARVLLRIRVENKKALVDLNKKFGAAPCQALPLLRQAKAAGLSPVGICFHVGSQSMAAGAYEEALLLCRRLFDEAAAEGMPLSVLDIGGGLPIPSAQSPRIDIVAMMQAVNRQLDRLFADTEIWSEPGRYIVGTAVNLLASVIGTKERDGEKWYVLDEGLYGAFSGLIFDHWLYDIVCFRQGKKYLSTFVGPSCDGIDVVRRDVMIPELSIGDTVLVPDCGAYTSASATTFNGFSLAPTIVWEDELAARMAEAVS